MRRPLRWRSVADAIVVPLRSDSDLRNGAGVVTSHAGGYDYVSGTGIRRYSREVVPRPKTEGLIANQSIPRAIFGGFLFNHFGHFLLESLSRLWIEQVHDVDESVPLVWIGVHNGSVRPWMVEICRQIGMNREILVTDWSTGALAIEELLVPQAGFELREWMHPDQMRRLGTTPWSPGNTKRKVWLSRTGAGARTGGFNDEPMLEEVLAERGWTIVRPEELSIEAQVEVLAGASHVAGVEGSAFHGLVMVKEYGGTIDILQRQKTPNYKALALAGGWNQRMIKPVGGHVTMAPVANGLTGAFVDFPNWDGIDVSATALAIERSSRRND